MFHSLGRFASQHPWKILCAWIIAAAALTVVAPDWKSQSQDDDIRLLPERYPSVRAHRLLEQSFPTEVFASRAIFALERESAPLSAADFELVDHLVTRLEQFRQTHPNLPITGVNSYRDGPVGSRLTSTDRQCTLVQLALATPYLALQTREAVDRAEAELRSLLEAAGPDAPTLYVTGPAGIGRDLTQASAESLHHTTWATIVLVIVVLLLVYRSPLLALIPLVTIGLAVWVSLQILALATLIPGLHIVNVSQVFCIVILFGAGTDYCLFLISRYREELELGQRPESGVARSVRAVGGALAGSAGTVVVGLGMMGFAQFGKIRCAGPVIALGLIVGLLASLTLTPALLRLGGRAVFWPHGVRFLSRVGSRNFWDSLSGLVVKRPATVLIITLLPILALALLGMRVSTNFKPIGDLSPSSGSIRGLEAIQKHGSSGISVGKTARLTP
jgi:RND superfamily putative drug exporter